MLLSAHAPEDVSRLRAELVAHFERTLVEAVLVVPYAQGALRNELHRRGRVLEEQHTPAGSRVRVRAQPELVARWRGLLTVAAPSRAS